MVRPDDRIVKLLGGTEMGAFKSKIDVDTVTEIAQTNRYYEFEATDSWIDGERHRLRGYVYDIVLLTDAVGKNYFTKKPLGYMTLDEAKDCYGDDIELDLNKLISNWKRYKVAVEFDKEADNA